MKFSVASPTLTSPDSWLIKKMGKDVQQRGWRTDFLNDCLVLKFAPRTVVSCSIWRLMFPSHGGCSSV